MSHRIDCFLARWGADLLRHGFVDPFGAMSAVELRAAMEEAAAADYPPSELRSDSRTSHLSGTQG